MAEVSFPFEDVDVSETQFGQWASTLAGTSGVKGVPGDSNLLVSADNSGMQVRVAAGQAIVRGHFYENTLQATVPITSAGANTRIDAIVLELDLALNQIVLKAIAGTAVSSSPVAPTLVQTQTGVFQMLLAYVTIPNSTSSITAGMVTDLRTFVGSRIGIWTSATRPTSPVAQLTIGYNTTTGYHEVWNGSAWAIYGNPVWTTAGRPAVPALGQTGFNSTLLALETWNGTAWVAAGGSDYSPFLLMGA